VRRDLNWTRRKKNEKRRLSVPVVAQPMGVHRLFCWSLKEVRSDIGVCRDVPLPTTINITALILMKRLKRTSNLQHHVQCIY